MDITPPRTPEDRLAEAARTAETEAGLCSQIVAAVTDDVVAAAIADDCVGMEDNVRHYKDCLADPAGYPYAPGRADQLANIRRRLNPVDEWDRTDPEVLLAKGVRFVVRYVARELQRAADQLDTVSLGESKVDVDVLYDLMCDTSWGDGLATWWAGLGPVIQAAVRPVIAAHEWDWVDVDDGPGCVLIVPEWFGGDGLDDWDAYVELREALAAVFGLELAVVPDWDHYRRTDHLSDDEIRRAAETGDD